MGTTITTEPTVYLMLAGSAIAFDTRGELLETDSFTEGKPEWADAGICDHRGGGGEDGYKHLHAALTAAEENARLCGYAIVRVTAEGGA